MLDIQLRPLKDRIFDPLCKSVPQAITPLHITILAFLTGLISCLFATQSHRYLSLTFWSLNRALDCLDGALARHRNAASDLGGFLDLLGDFIIYSLIPISVAAGADYSTSSLLAVAFLEASFHVNNFILFFVAALVEKGVQGGKDGKRTKELTSVSMRPALIEGFESGALFTIMLAFPGQITLLSGCMAVLVTVGIVQRTTWVVYALR